MPSQQCGSYTNNLERNLHILVLDADRTSCQTYCNNDDALCCCHESQTQATLHLEVQSPSHYQLLPPDKIIFSRASFQKIMCCDLASGFAHNAHQVHHNFQCQVASQAS